MSMQDQVSDLLTRIRNAQRAAKPDVTFTMTKFNKAIVELLVEEGYLPSYQVDDSGKRPTLLVQLAYESIQDGKRYQPLISELHRVSRPGLRKYVGFDEISPFYDGLGRVIISTPKGLMSDLAIRKHFKKTGEKLGGEVIGKIV